MARFYGELQGSRGPASRLGSKSSGLEMVAASWAGAVKVELWESAGIDMARVYLSKWHGGGTYRVLYEGPVSGQTFQSSMPEA